MEVTSIGPFLKYYDHVHERTRRLLPAIPEGDLEWAPGQGRFTFGDLIRHLASIERNMWAETVHGRPSRYAGHGRELAEGKDAVIAYYDHMHEESRALFAALTDEQLASKCLTPAGTPITVGKWLRAMVEHEAHHRGQIYMMMGLRGIPTPPLYGLTSEDVRTRSVASGAGSD